MSGRGSWRGGRGGGHAPDSRFPPRPAVGKYGERLVQHQVPGRYPQWLEEKCPDRGPDSAPLAARRPFSRSSPPPFSPEWPPPPQERIIEKWDYQHGKGPPRKQDVPLPSPPKRPLRKQDVPFLSPPLKRPPPKQDVPLLSSPPKRPHSQEGISLPPKRPLLDLPPEHQPRHWDAPRMVPPREQGNHPLPQQERNTPPTRGGHFPFRGRGGRGRGGFMFKKFPPPQQQKPFESFQENFPNDNGQPPPPIIDSAQVPLPLMREDDLPEILLVEQKGSSLCCDLCDVTMSTIEQLQLHLVGAKHQKTLRKRGLEDEIGTPSKAAQEVKEALQGGDTPTPRKLVYCRVCSQSCPHDELGPHIASQVHLMAEEDWRFRGRTIPPFKDLFSDEEQPPPTQDDTPKDWAGDEKKGEDPMKFPLFCKTCNVSSENYAEFQRHLMGKRHLRATNKVPAPTGTEKYSFYCEICGVVTPSQQELDNHFKGRKHAWNVIMRQKDDKNEGQPSRPHRCELCDVSFVNEEGLTLHFTLKEHTDNVKNKTGTNAPFLSKPTGKAAPPTGVVPPIGGATPPSGKAAPPIGGAAPPSGGGALPSQQASKIGSSPVSPVVSVPTPLPSGGSGGTNNQFWNQFRPTPPPQPPRPPFPPPPTVQTQPQYPWSQTHAGGQPQTHSQQYPRPPQTTQSQVQYPWTQTNASQPQVQYPWTQTQTSQPQPPSVQYPWTQTQSSQPQTQNPWTQTQTSQPQTHSQYPWTQTQTTQSQAQYPWTQTHTTQSQAQYPWTQTHTTQSQTQYPWNQAQTAQSQTQYSWTQTQTTQSQTPYSWTQTQTTQSQTPYSWTQTQTTQSQSQYSWSTAQSQTQYPWTQTQTTQSQYPWSQTQSMPYQYSWTQAYSSYPTATLPTWTQSHTNTTAYTIPRSQ